LRISLARNGKKSNKREQAITGLNKQQTGRWGEKLAEEFLLNQGMLLLYRNFRSPFGEVDLVMQEGTTVVFVEVKTRSSRTFGFPEEAVTARKQEHLIKTVSWYYQEHPEWDGQCRIDVIAIEAGRNQPEPNIEWFKNAISQ
jgi:putative endonuclease